MLLNVAYVLISVGKPNYAVVDGGNKNDFVDDMDKIKSRISRVH